VYTLSPLRFANLGTYCGHWSARLNIPHPERVSKITYVRCERFMAWNIKKMYSILYEYVV